MEIQKGRRVKDVMPGVILTNSVSQVLGHRVAASIVPRGTFAHNGVGCTPALKLLAPYPTTGFAREGQMELCLALHCHLERYENNLKSQFFGGSW